MQRLLIPGCSFIWLFPGGYEAFAFSHQWVIFCFTADIGHRLCSSWCTTFSMLCRPLSPSFLLVYSLAVLDLEWNTPCMVMCFLVPMSVSFRSSRFQLTTVAGYRMTGTAKVLIAVTLLLLESLLLRTCLTQFL